jgi:hypothetical protein
MLKGLLRSAIGDHARLIHLDICRRRMIQGSFPLHQTLADSSENPHCCMPWSEPPTADIASHAITEIPAQLFPSTCIGSSIPRLMLKIWKRALWNGTPSLPAQGEQRHSPYFNIGVRTLRKGRRVRWGNLVGRCTPKALNRRCRRSTCPPARPSACYGRTLAQAVAQTRQYCRRDTNSAPQCSRHRPRDWERRTSGPIYFRCKAHSNGKRAHAACLSLGSPDAPCCR